MCGCDSNCKAICLCDCHKTGHDRRTPAPALPCPEPGNCAASGKCGEGNSSEPSDTRMSDAEFERACETVRMGYYGPVIIAEARRAREAEEWQEQCRAIEEARVAALEAALREIAESSLVCGNPIEYFQAIARAALARPPLGTAGRRER